MNIITNTNTTNTTNATNFNPLGPINSGQNVTLVVQVTTVGSSIPYVATYSSSVQGSVILMPLVVSVSGVLQFNTSVANANVLQLAVSGTMSQLALDLKSTPAIGSRLLPNNNNVLQLVPNNTSTFLSISNTIVPPLYQKPSTPGILFTGPSYPLTGANGQLLSMLYFDDNSGTVATTSNLQAIFIPTVFYVSGACSNGILDPVQALQIFLCTINMNGGIVGSFCNSASSRIAWTNSADCNNNVRYNYCPSGSFCGTNNCNGACSNATQSCAYTTSSNMFTCMNGTNNNNNNNPFYTTTAFLVIVAVIIIIVVAIIAYSYNSYSNSSTNSYMNNVNPYMNNVNPQYNYG